MGAVRGGGGVAVFSNDGLPSPTDILNGLVSDLGALNALAVVVQAVPRTVDYLHGWTFLGFFVPLIRRFWPDYESTHSLGRLTSHLVSPEMWDPIAAESSTSPTVIGELYANFSWIGVLVGMAILGGLVRWVYDRNAGADRGRAVTYAVFLSAFVVPTTTGLLSQTAWVTTVYMLPVAFGTRWARRKPVGERHNSRVVAMLAER
jgi:hypothetical protein